ncbi:doublecortin domain-containing protein 1-like [Haliotis cracherodii]|uniref:doublecortin domain-containing protein 1-like n=1 Tax=Haliotis cracherodii TaxID=6455 RepID=UPI0039E884BB
MPKGGDMDVNRMSSRDKNVMNYNPNNSGMISYEDLLIAQYLEEMKKSRAEVKKDRELPASPYLQRFPPTPTTATYSRPRRRPASAVNLRNKQRSEKPKIDAKFIADPSMWDPETPREKYGKHPRRPASAPVRRVSRPVSGVSSRYSYFRPSSGKRPKGLYRRQPHTIRVVAFKNGTRDSFVRATAPNIKMLLEFLTVKLGLPFAARRIFLEDGIEVFEARDILPESDVYISMGENYKDPHLPTKRNLIQREGAVWTLSGIMLPEEGKKKKTRSCLSRRMKTLIEQKRVRILVYRNGRSKEPMEVVADLANTEEFLVACTAKLDLRCHARTLYDWEGNEITDLSATPILDDCLQPGGTPVMGPLWVSIGEGFSPTGTADFISSIKQIVKSRLKEVKKYRTEINFAMSDEDKDKVTVAAVLSLKPDQLYEALDSADDDVDKLTKTLSRLKVKLDALEAEREKEEAMGAMYKMAHIQELNVDDRLLGTKGLKLKVYENGMSEGAQNFFFNLRGALKGIGHDRPKLMARLLDELSTGYWSSGGVNPKLNAVAQKLYDKYGREITNVLALESEQEVWVSYGEAFICPFTYCVELFFDKATKLEIEGATHVVREPLMQEDAQATDEHGQWDATIGFPVMYESAMADLMMQDPDKMKWMTECAEVDERGFYLLHKKRKDLALYPELVVNEKFRLRPDDKRPAESEVRRRKELQTWVITQSGYIICKFMPQLCLGVSDTTVKGRFFDRDAEMEGQVVTLQKKMAQNPNQMWRFTTDATIASVACPDKVLTYLGNKFGDDESYTENPPEGSKSGVRVYLIVSEPKSRKEGSCQRFGLKQEKFDNLGQWKYTQARNSEWHKLAYSWPITTEGELNERYDWPMEGYLMPHAPPLHKSDKKSGLTGVAPLRLWVMKNGERDKTTALQIVGPNLTTMMKEAPKKDKKDGGRGRKKDTPVNHADSVDIDVTIGDLTVRELEFLMFLGHCTSLLDLPFAARRMFDETGVEHFTLQSLQRDQLVFVTCGEQWSDPKLNKTEQQRRFLLSQLSTDVAKIRQFVALRDPQGFVMEMEGGLTPNVKVVVNKCWTREEDEAEERAREVNTTARQEEDQGEEDFTTEHLNAHHRAHLKSEKRLDTLRWPWERLVNVGNSFDDSDPEAVKYSNKDLYEKYRPRPSPRVSRDTLQRFVYEDGFIACSANHSLVLGVQEQEGRVIDVYLQKRRPDDINQRWVMKENGEICSKYNQQMALTIAMPSVHGDNRPLTFTGCAVTLQARRLNQYGKAHQRWRYDAETGFIYAFYADQYDKEITAANRADVCTSSVSHAAVIDQPGYIAEVNDRKNRDIRVCLSCARAMRGRFKLQRLPNNKPFACAMGQAKKLKLRHVGSFCVLNGKVDLSTPEAEISLHNWEESLTTLRDETSVKTIARQISAAKSVRTVKLLMYKNGEGRMRAGEKVYGSSIQGILNQCTHQLRLNKPATRLYTEDGVLILDMDDLVDWAVENYKAVMADRIEKIIMMENSDSEQSGTPIPEGGDNRVGLQDQASQEVHSQLARAMQNMEQFDEDERGGGDAEERGAGDVGEEQDAREEKTELDSQETRKVERKREELLSRVPLPPLETILRYPIELWVSSGKNFVPPEVVESKDINRKKKRAFRAQVSLDLDIEKHVLRQMKARRMDELSPGEYKSTLSTSQPVVIQGQWQQLTPQEQDKHDTVHKLETHLGEIKANQRLGLASVNLKGKLYHQPNMKRVQVYPNGESLERALYVWGETLDQLLESSTHKLTLWRKAQMFFTSDGKLIETFEDIERDQLLCVSTGKAFKKPRVQMLDVEVKASWGRARREYGPSATDVRVDAKGNPKVDVDPFGPPELALPLEAPK